MRPTFLPAEVSLRTVEAIPICWWLPPPWGCSTGFMATPLTLGQQLRLTLYLWYARPAFKRGLSIRPPPATTPTVARHRESRTFLAPEGSLIRVLPVSGLWEIMVQEFPEALARRPRSPYFISRPQHAAPSGICPRGMTFPM